MSPEQAAALWSLIESHPPASDAEHVARLNATPGVAEMLLTERSLAAHGAVGPAGAAAVLVTLEGFADQIKQREGMEAKVTARMVEFAVARLTTDGVNLADPASLGLIDQLAQQMPNSPLAELAPAIKAMVPSMAAVTIGRPVTAADVAAARRVAAAREEYHAAVSAASDGLTAEIEAALGA